MSDMIVLDFIQRTVLILALGIIGIAILFTILGEIGTVIDQHLYVRRSLTEDEVNEAVQSNLEEYNEFTEEELKALIRENGSKLERKNNVPEWFYKIWEAS